MTTVEVSLAEQREQLLKEARDIVEKAKSEDRAFTEDEQKSVDEKLAKARELADTEKARKKTADTLAALDAMVPATRGELAQTDTSQAKTIGEHFVKHAHDRLISAKGQRGAAVSAPEFKAATDTHVITGWTDGVPYLTDYDRTIVQTFRPRLVVADLLGKGQVSGNAISYLVEGALEGDFETVAEGGAKPQLHVVNPTAVVDAVRKIAGWIKLTDEFLEDADFLASEINTRLLYRLGHVEEQQLLYGNGQGNNISGILDRDNVQTETSTAATDDADAVFRAMTKIETVSGLAADGLVIHPTDYQTFRLSKDSNDQYYGGGFFQGQYGVGGMMTMPNIWGLRTVVTPNITQGSPLVGAFGTAATLYRKGGVRVESTNSHDDDFTNNLVTIRVEERIALAVRVPTAFCSVDLSGGS